ncbi:MAG: LysR family transcriptional regulator [Burkholderiaceae bacterium]|nr:LysR family transcriptional regulator [Burkholderiaceae bacterium]
MQSLFNRKTYNLGLWELFFKVLDEGSFSRVADQRGLERTQVSRLIKLLETEIGHELLVRNGPKIVPTHVALDAKRYIQPVLRNFDEALLTIKASGKEDAGTIRIGSRPGLMQAHLVPLLKEFQSIYPQITFDIFADDDPRAFMRGQTDLMLYYGPVNNPNLIETWITHSVFIACASPGYIRERGIPNTPKDLLAHTGIIYTGRARSFAEILESEYEQLNYQWKSTMRFNNILAAKAAVIADAGIILDMPMHHCYKELISGELVPVLNNWHVPQLENYIACTVESVKVRRVQRFMEWFVQRRREIESEMKHKLQHKLGLKF